jgi:hypothetical protein
MWDKKRLMSEAKGRVPAVSPHLPHRLAYPRRGLQTGAHGSAAGSGARVTKLGLAKQPNVASEVRTFRQAQRERNEIISVHTLLEEKRELFRSGYSIVRY